MVYLKITGIYADCTSLKEHLKAKFPIPPEKPTEEFYKAVIDADVGMMLRMVIVFTGLNMSIIRKSLDESIGASLKKLTDGKDHTELIKK